MPTGTVTPPPPDFDPTPPPDFDPGTDDAAAWTRDYVELMAALLNSDRAIEEVLDTLVGWAAPEEGSTEDAAAATWQRMADLDEDGTEELLISAVQPGVGCGVTWCPVYLGLFEQEGGLWIPQHVVTGDVPDEVTLGRPEIERIADINNDGEVEVVLIESRCGAHTCFTTIQIGQWDGSAWRDLTADAMDQAYSEVTLEDRDDDDVIEIEMYGGTFGSVGAGLQRQETLIFDWEDGAYRRVEVIPDPSDHPYYLMVDANRALAEGSYDTALDLALQAVESPDFEDSMVPVEEIDRARIISYAALEAMLVHAQRGNEAAMEEVLELARTQAPITPNAYLEAGEVLLDVYRDTGDVVDACAAMEDVIADEAEPPVFFQWYGYGTQRLTVDQICPLDEPSAGESPQL